MKAYRVLIVMFAASCWGILALPTMAQTRFNRTSDKNRPAAEGTAEPSSVSAAAIPVEGYKLAWADEFDGSSLDPAKWELYDEGASGKGVVVKDLATVGDGLLTINAYSADGKQLTGLLSTGGKLERNSGYFEVRIKFENVPRVVSVFRIETQMSRFHGLAGPGMAVTSRTRPVVQAPGAYHSYSQTRALVWNGGTETRSMGLTPAEDLGLDDGFHVYGFELDKGICRYFVDGKQKWSAEEPAANKPKYIVLGSEVGGRAARGVNPASGPGLGNTGSVAAGDEGLGDRRAPRMLVDYVRFYEPSALFLGDYAYATNSNRQATITGFNRGYVGALSITNALGGCLVTGFKERAFFGCGSLMAVTIPSSVASIPTCAFLGCQRLTSVTIPGSVTSIGHEAFSGCGSLSNMVIPGSVISISSSAFRGCTNLTAISVDAANASYSDADGVLVNKSQNTLVHCPPGRAGSYTVPGSVTSIGAESFYGCTRLTSVTIPASVTSIGTWAFGDCSNLANVTLPGSVTSLGYSAFYGCTRLTSVTIPASVTSIGGEAFNRCGNLTNVTMLGSVTSLGWKAFADCCSLSSVTIPGNVTNIAKNAFVGCIGLTNSYFKAYSEGDSRTNLTPMLAAEAGGKIEWESARASITTQGNLTVEVTVNVTLDDSPGKVSLYLQQLQKLQEETVTRTPNSSFWRAAQYKTIPLGNPQEADVTVEKGQRTLTLKRTVLIQKDLAEVDVWTPLFIGSAARTSVTKQGHVKILWQDNVKPSVSVIMPNDTTKGVSAYR